MKTSYNANCPKFLADLDRLVDGCMTKKEEEQFLHSIESNVECLEQLEIQKAYKEFLATKLERKCCSRSLLYNIQDCTKEE